MRGHHEALRVERDALLARLEDRIWLPPALAEGWLAERGRTIDALAALGDQLLVLRDGYAALPLDEGLDTPAPQPIAFGAAPEARRA
ncbi:hypothetical protein [Leptothrix discophora]|uniref:Uncharacterized protein n=1 Tax=Leptothrix discophora TaxID=89 RepID=A0ABT9FZ82_LEPDI|nr:hypothetical protein [Leptothrix discophora]MDP4299548.1 hypothetical protein [Leptothrix discophora]